MTSGEIHVAIVGTGDIGRGWASTIAAAGWPVSLYDNDERKLDAAPADIARRTRALVTMHRANPKSAEAGIERIVVGRSLLQTCREAQWVIDCTGEDLRSRQKLFESLESVAHNARVVSSSTIEHTASELAAGVHRKDRCMVIHPIDPVELIPLVEIIPSPETDRAILEVVKAWLKVLGKFPITLKKPVRGNVAARITAAVWREAIDLVESGVIDADELDRAVSLGPALAWAACGPLLSAQLAAGDQGVSTFFQHLLRTLEFLWDDLADWKSLEPERQSRIIHAIERSYQGQLSQIRRARDRRLAGIMKGLESARRSRPQPVVSDSDE